MNPKDLIDRELNIGDYVVFYSSIYIVKSLGKPHPQTGTGMVRIMLADPSPTTRPVNKHSRDLCKLDGQDVTMWLLKKGH